MVLMLMLAAISRLGQARGSHAKHGQAATQKSGGYVVGDV